MYFLGWGLCILKEFVEFVAVLLGCGSASVMLSSYCACGI